MYPQQSQLCHNKREHATHTGDSRGVPGSYDQQVLWYKAPLDPFYTRLLLSRLEDVAGLCNTQKQTQ